jgi:hypothetical protein
MRTAILWLVMVNPVLAGLLFVYTNMWPYLFPVALAFSCVALVELNRRDQLLAMFQIDHRYDGIFGQEQRPRGLQSPRMKRPILVDFIIETQDGRRFLFRYGEPGILPHPRLVLGVDPDERNLGELAAVSELPRLKIDT